MKEALLEVFLTTTILIRLYNYQEELKSELLHRLSLSVGVRGVKSLEIK